MPISKKGRVRDLGYSIPVGRDGTGGLLFIEVFPGNCLKDRLLTRFYYDFHSDQGAWALHAVAAF